MCKNLKLSMNKNQNLDILKLKLYLTIKLFEIYSVSKNPIGFDLNP